MKKNLYLFALVLIFISGCTIAKIDLKYKEVSNIKLKLTVVYDGDINKAKGIILFKSDSDNIYFNFYGPLGINILKGSYINSFYYRNNLENKDYFNTESIILKKFGLNINKKIIKFLLLGDIGKVRNEILSINSINPEFNFLASNNEFTITDKINMKFIKVQYRYKYGLPKKVLISVGNASNIDYSITMEYVKISG